MARSLAIDQDGNLSYCSVSPENRGTKGCTHTGHQSENQSTEEFMKSVEIYRHEHIDTSVEEEHGDLQFMTNNFQSELRDVDLDDYLYDEDQEELRGELETNYDISDESLREKVLQSIALSRKWIKEGDYTELPSFRVFSDYEPEKGFSRLIPELQNPEHERLSKDLDSYTELSYTGDDCEVYPSSLSAAGEIRESKSEKWDVDAAREDENYMVEE